MVGDASRLVKVTRFDLSSVSLWFNRGFVFSNSGIPLLDSASLRTKGRGGIWKKGESKNTSTRQRQGTKARDIYKAYPKAKADALIQKLRDRGLWYFDPGFPADEEDTNVFVSDVSSASSVNLVIQNFTIYSSLFRSKT